MRDHRDRLGEKEPERRGEQDNHHDEEDAHTVTVHRFAKLRRDFGRRGPADSRFPASSRLAPCDSRLGTLHLMTHTIIVNDKEFAAHDWHEAPSGAGEGGRSSGMFAIRLCWKMAWIPSVRGRSISIVTSPWYSTLFLS